MADKVNLEDAYATFDEPWQPRIAAHVNDYDVKIARGDGSIPEHVHAETDEFFLVLEGELTLAMPDGDVVLGAGEVYTVPAGTPHAPSAMPGTKLLFIEPRGVLNTGDGDPSGTAGHELDLT